MWQMVGITRGIAAVSLGTINQGQNEKENISGLIVWGDLLDLFVYEMKEMRRGVGLTRMLYCLRRGSNLFDVSLSAAKWIQILGCWGEHMYCKRARSWTNERTHASKNRPVNIKAGIYVCSELWKPQGQNIYMKSAVGACLRVQACIFVCAYICTVRVCPHLYAWVFVSVCVCLCTCVIGGNRTMRCQKRKWNASLVISRIYHCGNQHQRKCRGRLETLIRGIRNQTTHWDGAKPYRFSTEGESRKFIISTPSPPRPPIIPSPRIFQKKLLLSLIQ